MPLSDVNLTVMLVALMLKGGGKSRPLKLRAGASAASDMKTKSKSASVRKDLKTAVMGPAASTSQMHSMLSAYDPGPSLRSNGPEPSVMWTEPLHAPSISDSDLEERCDGSDKGVNAGPAQIHASVT